MLEIKTASDAHTKAVTKKLSTKKKKKKSDNKKKKSEVTACLLTGSVDSFEIMTKGKRKKKRSNLFKKKKNRKRFSQRFFTCESPIYVCASSTPTCCESTDKK